jgi:predicted Zn-dependent protease
MLDEKECRHIVETVLKESRAEETEVFIGGGALYLTRFSNNAIHQNVSESNFSLTVRSVLGDRTGRATTHSLEEEAIQKAARLSFECAQVSEPDDTLMPLPGPQTYPEVAAAYDEATAVVGPEQRVEQVAEVIERCEERGLKASGYISNAVGSIESYGNPGVYCVANSKGLFGYHAGTKASCNITVEADDSSGWANGESHRFGEIDVKSLAQRAIEKTFLSAHPVSIDPGAYTVILEPAAVASLLEFLLYSFNAQSIEEKTTFLEGRVGQQVFSPLFSLCDDALDPHHLDRPFDYEGIPRRRVVLVDGGILKSFVYSRHLARKYGVKSTGHGLPIPNTIGAVPLHPVVATGQSSLEAMIEETDRGVLVTRFWYTNFVDQKKVILSGMTRDGTFLVEGGKITAGLKNLRFNQSIPEMLNRIACVSREAEVHEGMAVPGMKVEAFNFSSPTLF